MATQPDIQESGIDRAGARASILPPAARRARSTAPPLRAQYRATPPLGWLVPGLVLLLGAHYIAVVAGAWYAFTDWNGLSSANVVGLRNFEQIFRDPAARLAFGNTIALAVTFVVGANLVGLFLALGLYRGVKSRNLLRSAFFAPVALSPLAVAYIWQFIFSFQGPLNIALGALGLTDWRRPWVADPSAALWTVLVVLIWQFSGLMMMFYLAGLHSIPEEVEEAAAVDGAGSLARLWHVTLPLLAPALTVALTFSAVLGLRVFDQVVALTNGGPAGLTETLATQVYKQTWTLGRFGYGAAFALLLSAFVGLIAVAQLVVLRRREQQMA